MLRVLADLLGQSFYACPVLLSSIPRIISIAEESSVNDILTDV